MSLMSPVLVGRQAEAAFLARTLESARRRHGSSAFIIGEPGIGKSRLTGELATEAAKTGVRVLRGRAGSGGSAVPFRPLSEALFSVLREPDAPGSAELGPYWPVLSRMAPTWRQDGPAVEDSLVVRAEALLRLLALLGEGSACILLLEDLHDADADTLAVVDYLVDNLAHQPVLLLGTLRPDPGPGLELASAATARRVARTVRLARLTPEETSQLAGQCLGAEVAEVPEAVLTRLHRDADGIPFVVEELLSAMADSGSLVRRGSTWTVDGAIAEDVPVTVSSAILRRVERLEEACVALLEAAAVLGRRFSVRVAADVVGIDEEEAFRLLRPAALAQLIVADPSGDVDWYAFRHALTADAMLGHLLPGERAALSRTAARAVQAASTELGDDWYQLAAELAASGGDRVWAAELFTQAGRLATSRGALASAVELLDRGLVLLDGAPDAPAGTVADLLDWLIQALTLTGATARVFALGDRLDAALEAAGAPTARRAAARLPRARAAAAAGRCDDGLDQVAAARALLGDDPPPELAAPVDAVAAHLVLGGRRSDRLEVAAALAERSVTAAESVPLPAVACEALEVLGRCARQEDMSFAQGFFERALALAEKHDLTVWRSRALFELGILDKLRYTDPARLLAARDAAMEAGALSMVIWADIHLSTVYLVRSEIDESATCTERAMALARQLRYRELELLALGQRAGIAAHLSRRDEMEVALAACEEAGDYLLGYGTEVVDWFRGMCSLLEEEPERALTEFASASAADEALPTTRTSGVRGPYLLLRVVRGDAGWPEYEQLATSRLAQVAWHQPFIAWSKAVLLGREGRREEAGAAAAEAVAVAGTVPLARSMGMRLAAEAALADAWGDPVSWLREAEEYFHRHQIARAAAACRALLRQAGAHLSRRRRGSDAIPDELRRVGITVREYEVLQLLADRLGNQQIAERLFLSPRTVEKHVASLLTRSGQPDRAGLVSFARLHAVGGPRGRGIPA
jgi:DNA-binding CsgD family transcriptional regulator